MNLKIHFGPGHFCRGRFSRQTLVIMKLIVVLTLFANVGLCARGTSQITISETNAPLEKIFREIQNQSGYNFICTYNILEKFNNVSVYVRNASLEKAIDESLKGKPLAYTIIGKTVVVKIDGKQELIHPGVSRGIPDLISDYRGSGSNLFNPLPSAALASPPPVEISGTVSDEDGRPLANASVTVKGSNQGVTTDEQGRFAISVPNQNAVLVISFTGYASAEIRVGGRGVLEVSLKRTNDPLSEVVVVGYGSQKKSDLTGSISSIKGSDVTQLSSQRVDQALQGRAAGIMVLNTDGAPGGNTTIRIRGVNSINGNNDALIVIDGLQGGDLTSLNPNDIASIEVLKDASATAIYGSQGANGVVLITTKKGQLGKPVINYNYDIGFSKILKKMPLMNAADYAKNINNVVLSQNGGGIDPQPVFTDADIQGFEKNGGTDWQDVIYRTAATQNHQLSISGATDKLNYRVSGGYLDQNGILLNSGYKRFSLRANLNAEITKWASFGLTWDGAKENSNSVLFGNSTDWPNNPIGAAIRFSPTLPVFDADGNYSKAALHYGNPTLWNPLASTVEPMNDNGTIRNSFNAFLDFRIIDGLTLRVSGGAILSNENDLSFYNDKTFVGMQGNGSGSQFTDKSEFYQNSNILTYDKLFGKHHLTFTAVGEQKYSKDFSSTIDAQDFLNQQTNVYDLSGANLRTIGSNYIERVINSYMGRVNYVYDNKYLLTASYRADGGSVFGKDNKWGYFPSAALAWKASEEDFIKNLGLFSELKLRGSWGITGSQAIQPYQTLAHITSGSNYPYDGGDATNIGFNISSAANPLLKWESTEQIDFGIDLGLFNNRLSFTGDYYKKTTRNLLMPRGLPTYTGLSSVIDNVGSMQNKGFEFSLAGDPVAGGNIRWHSSLQISTNRTKVLDLGDDQMIGYKAGGSGQGVNNAFMYLVVGQPFGQMYGWKYLGVWSTSEEHEAAAYGQLPGDPHYLDKDNDGRININDTTVIGNSMPKIVFGWSNDIRFKNFTLSFLIQGTQGNDIFNVARIALDATDGTSVRVLNRWTPENQNSQIPGIIDARTRENAALVSTISFPASSGNTLSRYVEDGSYVRLKSLMLSYNLPAALIQKIKFSNASVFVSGMNLVTITKYTGYDPEVSSYKGNDAQLGTDFNNYPSSRSFNLGLKVSF